MSANQEKNVIDPQADEHKNEESEHVLSKGAKKRAKKQAKKAAEAAEAATNPEKAAELKQKIEKKKAASPKSTPTKDSDAETSLDAKSEEATSSPKNDKEADVSIESTDSRDSKRKEQIVPKIQRFDANGKPVKTIAGHSFIHLGEITPHNVMQLKKLNEAVFPIVYNDKFYVEARTCGDLGRLAYYNDVVVGAVCARIDDISDEKSMYIMTLGTLAAYRQIGIGKVLIDYILKLAKRLDEIKTIYLHVQINNENAVKFYEKHGFYNDGVVDNYYRINPRNAYLLVKRLRY